MNERIVDRHFAELIGTILTAALATWLASGCASSNADDGPHAPVEGHAFLSIVGAADLFVDGGTHQTLTVQYHDESGHPLVGDIAFDLIGDPRGGDLSGPTATTDAEGLAHIDVVSGEEASFQVSATALYAAPVTWNVAIGPGGTSLHGEGAYQLESEFDLADGVPGAVGGVVNALLDMTDDPSDPATWVIDQLLTQINNPTVTSAVASLRPQLDVLLNDALLSNSPDFVATIVNVGDDLGQVARRFGAVSTLTVARDPDAGLIASHAIDAFTFTVEGESYQYTMSELELAASQAEGIKVSLRGATKLSIARHELPVAYGHLMVFVLDHAIIPAIDPASHSLGELLIHLIDCGRVGELLSQQIGVGPPILYDLACRTGLTVGGALIEDQLGKIDASTRLGIAGDARPKELTGDDKIDRLEFGQWEGELNFGSAASALARPKQKFTGERQDP